MDLLLGRLYSKFFGNLYLHAWRIEGFCVTFEHRKLTACGATLRFDLVTRAFLVGRDGRVRVGFHVARANPDYCSCLFLESFKSLPISVQTLFVTTS
jgi:hypothetical protein